MADMSALATTENYAALLARMDAKINGIAQMFMSDDPTNIPAGKTPIRFNSATSMWEIWNGTAWGALSSKYVITVDKADSLKDSSGSYRLANAGAVANTVAVRDAAGKLPGSITGDAATVGGKAYTYFATAAQGTKADAALPATSYTAADILTKLKTVDGVGSGLDADTVDGIAGASLITTGNINSQSVSYADNAGNATTASNATMAGGKSINTLPVANNIPVRGTNLHINELYSGTFNSLTATGMTISGLSLQQYGMVDLYVWAKLTTAVEDWLCMEINGDSNTANYINGTKISTIYGTTVVGFAHIRMVLGSGMHCSSHIWGSSSSSGIPVSDMLSCWKNTANVTQLRFYAETGKIIANGAKVVICRAA